VGILSKEAHDLYITAKDALLNDQIKNLFANSVLLEKTNLVLKNFNVELTGETLNNAISEIGKIVGLFLYEQARSVAANTLAFFANMFLMLLVIYFLLIDGSKLISFITDLSPFPKDQDEKLIQKFKGMAGAILIGNGLGGLIQGILGGTVFMLFGLKSPFLWGVIMSLLAFLPIIGIGVVFIPAAIYLFLKGQIASAIFFVIPEDVRNSWHYIRPSYCDRIFDTNRYLSCQLPETAWTKGIDLNVYRKNVGNQH
jgi:predicted PurR-regulated permease PerM